MEIIMQIIRLLKTSLKIIELPISIVQKKELLMIMQILMVLLITLQVY